MKKIKKILFIIPLLILAFFVSAINPKAVTIETMPDGYRVLTTDDVGKTFGVDLELDIYVLEYSFPGGEYGEYVIILNTFGIGETISLSWTTDNPDNIIIEKNDTSIYSNGTKAIISGDVSISMTSGEVIIDVFPDTSVNTKGLDLFYVKDIITPTLTFDTQGGNDIASIKGNAVPESLETPVKSGYLFQGWYYDLNYVDAVNELDPLIADITIYAKWFKIPIVTFESNGGNTIDSYTGMTIPELETPVKSGYLFQGWYYDLEFSNEVLEDDPLTEDITIYAKYEKIHLIETIKTHIDKMITITFNVFDSITNTITNNPMLIILLGIVMMSVAFGVIGKITGVFKDFK